MGFSDFSVGKFISLFPKKTKPEIELIPTDGLDRLMAVLFSK